MAAATAVLEYLALEQMTTAIDAAMGELQDEVLECGVVIPSQPVTTPPATEYALLLAENYATAAEEENVAFCHAEGGGFYYCRICCRGLPHPAPTQWRLDTHTGEYSCAGFDGIMGCGAVRRTLEWGASCYSRALADNRIARCEQASRRSVGVIYKRSYHWNERLSQRQATDPRVPREVVSAIRDWLTSGRGIQPALQEGDFPELDRAALHAILRRLGHNKLCERWYVYCTPFP
jgi:hypothetical protein